MAEIKKLKISTPGRLCLFGEHQDYLQLPIIAAAISKRIFVEGYTTDNPVIKINLPDISESETFSLNGSVPYKKERDYFRSCMNVLIRNNFTFKHGIECTVRGDIPINAGTSSSSALVVTWINFLSRLSEQKQILDPEKIAELAYQAEVLEFTEPGGMMDQYSTSLGNIIWLCPYPEIQLMSLHPKLGAFILGNSGQPKDTKDILSRVKGGVMKIVNYLKEKYPEFSLHKIQLPELDRFKKALSGDEYRLLTGTIKNRDITFAAKEILSQSEIDHKKIGALLNEHHEVLRDILKISTRKIERMIHAALDAGAYGAKINGSGGGGCMFAYAPEDTEKVLAAVKKISGDSHIVFSDEGTREENIN